MNNDEEEDGIGSVISDILSTVKELVVGQPSPPSDDRTIDHD